jgi:hypothetical protein
LEHLDILRQLERLNFEGKAEAFVESKFLTPLLECLGYETHRDYEVIRHGDESSSFKLRHPPVERGAEKVKSYSPDYVPTIRKKMFWIVEAKSPRHVKYPFNDRFLVQGLQYCVHPEIQAKYLLITNGEHSAVYDAHGSVFLDKEFYEPILKFRNNEICEKWSEIYNLLSVETLRTKIEADLKSMYNKLAQSSLDKSYPRRLLHTIGTDARHNEEAIEEHLRSLYSQQFQSEIAFRDEHFNSLSRGNLLALMNSPEVWGKSPSYYYVDRALSDGFTERDVFNTLYHDFDRQPIFRRIQSWIGIVHLYRRAKDNGVKEELKTAFRANRDGALPLIVQVDCVNLRLAYKLALITFHDPLSERLRVTLSSAPEIVRFVRPPTAVSEIHFAVTESHRESFPPLLHLTDHELEALLQKQEKIEASIEPIFKETRAKVPMGDWPLTGYEYYGLGGHHYAFKNILRNLKVDEELG